MSETTPSQSHPQPRLRRWVLPVGLFLGLCFVGFLVCLPLALRQMTTSGDDRGRTDDSPQPQPVVLPDAYREPTSTYGPQTKPALAPVPPVTQATLTPVPPLGNGATPPAPAALGAYQPQRRPVDLSQVPTAVLQNGHQSTPKADPQQPQQVQQGTKAAQAVAKHEGSKEKGRWGIELTHGQGRQPRQPTPKEQAETAQTDKAKNLLKHAIWAKPALPHKTLYRSQAIPAVTIDEMVSSIPGQYKLRVTMPVFSRFPPETELVPKNATIIVRQERVPGYGEKRMVVGVEEIQPPTPEVISLKATVGSETGAAGIGGKGIKVNNHFPELILATIISTAINIGGRVAAGNPSGYQYDVSQEIIRDAGQEVSREAKSIVDRTLKIPPTITVPAGTPVSISLQENVMFSRQPLTVR